MQSSYINLLSLSPCAKEVPYLGTGIAREDGQIDHGFKNLIAYPDLIDAIPELATDRSMKFLRRGVLVAKLGTSVVIGIMAI
jgi:hypothetical protein